MFNKKTVVIVGAGASKDFDLPTGADVYSKLLAENLGEVSYNYHPARDLFSSSFNSFLAFSNEVELQHQLSRFIEAVKKDNVANSIDLFANYYPEFTEISKLYSTWSILGSMYQKKQPRHQSGGYAADFDQSYLSPSDLWLNFQIPGKSSNESKENWLSTLLRKHLDGTDESSEIEKNLTIVTFNYDTIIEDFFSTSINNISKYKAISNELMPEILHVYGAFKSLYDRPNAYDILKHAENISYIHDTDTNDDESEISKIRDRIGKAESIFIVGFDAAPENCKRINLQLSPAIKFSVNYDGNLGLNNRLEDIGVKLENIMVGDLPKACKAAFFDQADRLSGYTWDNL